MGYHSDISPGLENEISPQIRLQGNIGNKFFTTTGREFPFCHRLYRINLELANPPTAENWVQGFLKASLHSSAGVIHLDLTPSGDMKLEHGSSYSMVLSHPADLGGNIKKVELNWEYDMNVLEPRTLCLFWCNDHLYVKSIGVDELELPGRGKRDTQFNSRLCARNKKDYADISNRGKGVFVDICQYNASPEKIS
ncbi:short-chain dehydrogenase/reductase [Holotrichia oblita]|nr:short-chain dehydrogenase/reductase [Holotrichia oblita]